MTYFVVKLQVPYCMTVGKTQTGRETARLTKDDRLHLSIQVISLSFWAGSKERERSRSTTP